MKKSSSVNYHSIIRMTGALFVVLGMSFIPTLIVAFIYSEYREALCFTATMIPCFVAGFVLVRLFDPTGLRTKQRDGYITVTLAWIISSIVGAVPMLLTGAISNPVDAFFEICSGFSTTGATIMSNIEDQARSVLFWRSFTHWLGGMGIIVFVTALLPSMGIGGQIVASAETPGPTLSKLTARFADTAKDLYKLYLVFTAAETVLLLAGGMSPYDALVHTFGTVGTGGFSSYNDNIGHFQSPYLQWVIIVFMLMCGVNFNLYFCIVRRKIKDLLGDEELRFYLLLVLVFAFASAVCLMTQGSYTSLSRAIRDSFFHIVAIVTTTGYTTTDYNVWPTFCKMLIIVLTITGACASSTGGGVKMIRILTAIKFVKRGFFMKLHPHRVINITINRQPVQQTVVSNIVNFVFLYVAVLFVGMTLVSIDGYDIVTNFTAAATCLSNVGPGLAAVGPASNFAGYSDFSTFVLAMLMIAGRLELFTFFMMFSRHYWNSDRV